MQQKKSVVLGSVPLTEVFGVTRKDKINKKSTPKREHLNLNFSSHRIAKFSVRKNKPKCFFQYILILILCVPTQFF